MSTIDVTVYWTDHTVYEVERTVSIEAMQDYYREQGPSVIAEVLPTLDLKDQMRWARVCLQSTNAGSDWTNLRESRVSRREVPEILSVEGRES
jgi:hypothetical protein